LAELDKKIEVASPGHPWILLTPARAVNQYGDIEISRIRQIRVEHGKELTCGSIDELQDAEEL
jgi:hypothetical protein